ncbi:MAG: hypothetical protein IKS55_09400, partial [Oscillospiraceae bacterium]|nr:hypothetical protein [Oscillospiraceae bacterium]
AVPGESFGLTLILRFSDRCSNPAMPSSATGSGIARFHKGKGACGRGVAERSGEASLVRRTLPARRYAPYGYHFSNPMA